jgi:hypothetical protein
VTALREAANPLPLTASFAGVHQAVNAAAAFGDRPGPLRDEVLAVLGHPAPPSGSLGLTAAPGPRPTGKYLWTAAHWLAPAGCITFIRDLRPAQVLAAFGGSGTSSPDTGRPGLFPDPVAAIREDSGWTVVVEYQELMGLWSRYEKVRPGPAVSLSWSARGRCMIHYVADGRMVATLDPQRPDFCEEGDWAVFGAHTADLPLGDGAPSAAGCLPMLLVLAERLTGLVFTPQSLDEPHLLAVLPPPGLR